VERAFEEGFPARDPEFGEFMERPPFELLENERFPPVEKWLGELE
jgi:hypothetical protein